MNKNEKRNPSYLFGPVPSRRLGISLGVDLVPYKTCTMDCVYCESGRTTDLTLKRSEFYPTEEIIREIDSYLSMKPELDYITFSGAGEPTLHSGIGEIIKFIKSSYPEYKICLLTNGILLQDEKTFNEVKGVDLIIPSLDAPNLDICRKINRPAGNIDQTSIIETLARFHRESDALFILEVFLIPGINDSEEAIKGFYEAIKKIQPDKVQLNSLDRPGTESWVPKIEQEDALRIKKILSDVADIEIIGKFSKSQSSDNSKKKDKYQNLDQKVLDLISRRPCTSDDMVASLGFSKNTIGKLIHRMLEKGLILSEKRERGEFFRPSE